MKSFSAIFMNLYKNIIIIIIIILKIVLPNNKIYPYTFNKFIIILKMIGENNI